MNIIIFGAAGFIGINLTKELCKDRHNFITVVDRNRSYFKPIESMDFTNLRIEESQLGGDDDYERFVKGQEIVFHLVSTSVPSTSNQAVADELNQNIGFSVSLLEACVRQNVKKIVFLSSGGAIYGKESQCPIKETAPEKPISSYGVQKSTIEKLLYLYHYMHGLDYRIVRLANPYGPYQRPNGVLGAVTTFIYKALKGEEIQVYGDGSVIRDFIYIDDAIKGILNIANGTDGHHVFNLGSGYGTSISTVLKTIHETLNLEMKVKYMDGRQVDVPVNYLDISKYENIFGELEPVKLEEGIKRTAAFMERYYGL